MFHAKNNMLPGNVYKHFSYVFYKIYIFANFKLKKNYLRTI